MPKSRLSSRRFQLVLMTRIRRAFGANLDLTDAHKVKIYEQLCESVSLKDISYWLEVILAAGIATLGLVLNSPAVIIGAMLISPLMGTILANGLGLAAGDIILWLRAAFNLLLSCGVAIAFAMILVFLVPFKEMTPEIAARTQPTLLDLIVALFSGAVGSVATCKQVKGVAASLPGVAIAVALMPPLCVVGYGIGTYLSLNSAHGLVVAKGGGLLFITNLVAIIFTAMIVFFFVQFDTHAVREQVEIWKSCNPESRLVATWLSAVPRHTTFRRIGGLPSRFFLILVTLGVISFPLNTSLSQLRQQVAQQQEANQLRATIKTVWQNNLNAKNDGQATSFIDQIKTQDENNILNIQLQVVTDHLYTRDDQQRFTEQLAQALKRSPSQLNVRIVQIPTSQIVDAQPSPLPSAPIFTSIADLQKQLMEAVESALASINFPPTLPLVSYQVLLREGLSPPKLLVVYLGDRDLQADAQAILSDQIQTSLQINNLQIQYQRIAQQQGSIAAIVADPETTLDSAEIVFSPQDKIILDKVGDALQSYPNLNLQLTVERNPDSNPASLLSQTEALRNYWAQNWKIPDNRIQETDKVAENNQFQFSFVLSNVINPDLPTIPLPGAVSPSPNPSPKVNPYNNGIF
ncbi:MAG: DUF389 domain-containing protein [Synechocystis sp.]